MYKAVADYFALRQRIVERKEKEAREAAEKAEQVRIAREKREAEEKARLEKEAEEEREGKASAEKERQDAFHQEHAEERMENIKKLFSIKDNFYLLAAGGIVVLFLLVYVINNIEFPAQPEPAKTPEASIPATATLKVPTFTSLPTLTSTPTKTPTPTSPPASTENSIIVLVEPTSTLQAGTRFIECGDYLGGVEIVGPDVSYQGKSTWNRFLYGFYGVAETNVSILMRGDNNVEPYLILQDKNNQSLAVDDGIDASNGAVIEYYGLPYSGPYYLITMNNGNAGSFDLELDCYP